jgi:hypothetical protein
MQENVMQLSEITPEVALELLELSLKTKSGGPASIPDCYLGFFVSCPRGWQLSDAAFDAVMRAEGVYPK